MLTIAFPRSHSTFVLQSYQSLSFFSISLVININFYSMFYWPLLIEHPIHISYMISLSIFFNLNSFSLANSELITNPIVLLYNKASTIIHSCVSIFSSPIFTVTSLSNHPLSSDFIFSSFIFFFFFFSSLKIILLFFSLMNFSSSRIPACIT